MILVSPKYDASSYTLQHGKSQLTQIHSRILFLTRLLLVNDEIDGVRNAAGKLPIIVAWRACLAFAEKMNGI